MTKESAGEPLISVIIPVYNVEKYIDRCMETVLNQTYRNLEIILVDDGSTDSSGEKCDMYAQKDARVKVIHKENGGVSSARNAGLNIFEGGLLTFVDADDKVSNEYVEYLFSLICNYDADIAACNYMKTIKDSCEFPACDEDNIKTFDNSEALINVLYKKELAGYCVLKLYKRKVVENTLFNVEMKVAEDFEWTINVMKNASLIVYGNQVLYLYFQNPNSCMHDNEWQKYEKTWTVLSSRKAEMMAKSHEISAAYQDYLFFGDLGYYTHSTHWKGAENFKENLIKDISELSKAVINNDKAKKIHRMLAIICRINAKLGCEFCRIFMVISGKCNYQLRRSL